jgi:hypothetical protein
MPNRFKAGRGALARLVAVAVVCSAGYAAFCENFTMTTYYPSPSGVYRKLISTAQTLLARDGGSVGVGTPNPQAKLDVNGPVKVGATAAGCGGALAGALRYNAAKRRIQLCQGSKWVSLAVEPPATYTLSAPQGERTFCRGSDKRINCVQTCSGRNHWITLVAPNGCLPEEGPNNYGSSCGILTCESDEEPR